MKGLDKIKMMCSCGGRYKSINTNFKGVEIRGWECNKCSDILLHPLDVQQVLELEEAKKQKKLKVKIRKINKSLVVTIPEILAKKLKPGITANWNVDSLRRYSLQS